MIELIEIIGHDFYNRKYLKHVEEDLYEIVFPDNSELGKYTRVGFTQDISYEDIKEGKYDSSSIEFIDPSGGPLLFRGLEIGSGYKIKDFFKTDKQIYIQLEKV